MPVSFAVLILEVAKDNRIDQSDRSQLPQRIQGSLIQGRCRLVP